MRPTLPDFADEGREARYASGTRLATGLVRSRAGKFGVWAAALPSSGADAWTPANSLLHFDSWSVHYRKSLWEVSLLLLNARRAEATTETPTELCETEFLQLALS